MGMIRKAQRYGKKYLNPVPTSVGDLSSFFKILRRYASNREETTPKRSPGPFSTDARVFQNPPANGLRVTWMGHSSSLIEIDGVRVLIDPVWNQRAAPVEWLGPKRFFAPPLRLEDLPPLDVILFSHDHYDHMGAMTVRRLAELEAASSAQWVAPLGVGKLLRGWGVGNVRELDWTESLHLGSLVLTALPARHFSGRSAFNRFHTLWASFVLAGPKHRVFYGADSGEWDGLVEIAQAYGPFDLTMLEIGAYDPLWGDIHMGPAGAIRTFRAMG
jgi:L-ascorbate metabolism protein UlaG (beta-lactamase superfamily)